MNSDLFIDMKNACKMRQKDRPWMADIGMVLRSISAARKLVGDENEENWEKKKETCEAVKGWSRIRGLVSCEWYRALQRCLLLGVGGWLGEWGRSHSYVIFTFWGRKIFDQFYVTYSIMIVRINLLIVIFLNESLFLTFSFTDESNDQRINSHTHYRTSPTELIKNFSVSKK